MAPFVTFSRMSAAKALIFFGDSGFQEEHGGGAALGGLGLVAFSLERCEPVFQRRVGGVSYAVLDCLVEP